jgi:pSer/pThr/pTyr-binding forkhead associated (FHA) protein
MRWGEQVFPLDNDLMRIGRAPQNEIVMRAAGISRFHAQVQRQGNEWVLEDLDSTNGTHVSGRTLTAPYTLRNGDVVYFCDQRVVFEA